MDICCDYLFINIGCIEVIVINIYKIFLKTALLSISEKNFTPRGNTKKNIGNKYLKFVSLKSLKDTKKK